MIGNFSVLEMMGKGGEGEKKKKRKEALF